MHLLSLGVPCSSVWKVPSSVSQYDKKKKKEYIFPGTLKHSEGCLLIQKTALVPNWGCAADVTAVGGAVDVAATCAARGVADAPA